MSQGIISAEAGESEIGDALVASGADIIAAAERLERLGVPINANTMNGIIVGDNAQQHNTFGR